MKFNSYTLSLVKQLNKTSPIEDFMPLWPILRPKATEETYSLHVVMYKVEHEGKYYLLYESISGGEPLGIDIVNKDLVDGRLSYVQYCKSLNIQEN